MISDRSDPLAALWERAQHYEARSDLASAQKAYGAVLAGCIDGDIEPPLALLERLARLSASLGQEDLAEQFLAVAYDRAMEEQSSSSTLLLFTARLTCIQLKQARFDAAEQLLLTATDERGLLTDEERLWQASHEPIATIIVSGTEADCARARAEWALALSRYHAARGLFDAALKLTREAIAQARQAPDHFSLNDLQLLKAELLIDNGKLREAQHCLAKCAAGDRRDMVAARCAEYGGHIGAAISMLSRVNPPDLASQLHSQMALARLYAVSNRLGDALRLLRQCASRAETLGSTPLTRTVERMRLLTRRRLLSTQDELALPFVPQQVWDLPSRDNESTDSEATDLAPLDDVLPLRQHECLVDDIHRLANVVLHLLDEGNIDLALDVAELMSESAAETDSVLIKERVAYHWALVSYYYGAYEQAYQYAQLAERLSSQATLQLARWRSLRLLSWCAARQSLTTLHDQYAHEADEQLQELLKSMKREDAVYFMLNKWSARDEYVSGLLHCVEPPPLSWLPSSWLRHLAQRLWIHYKTGQTYRRVACLTGWSAGRLLSHTQTATPNNHTPPENSTAAHQVEAWVAQQLKLTSGSWRERGLFNRSERSKLAPNQALLHFYLLPECLVCFVVTRKSIQLYRSEVTRSELNELVASVLRTIQDASIDFEDGVDQELHALSSKLLLDPLLRTLPESVVELFIVPHDVLVNVPFAALPVAGDPLCARWACSFLPAPNWLRDDAKPGAGLNHKTQRLLAVGIADYQGSGYADLPGAGHELVALKNTVTDRFHDVCVLRDEDATISNVCRQLQACQWVHFSCHGHFDTGSPHSSGIWLHSDSGGFECLTLSMLSRCNLSQLDTVVSSCCWTSSTAVLPGQELVGLPPALLSSGANSVISPLWEIDDELGRLFIHDLYEMMAKTTHAAALAQTQLKWARSYDTRKRQRSAWAPFVRFARS